MISGAEQARRGAIALAVIVGLAAALWFGVLAPERNRAIVDVARQEELDKATYRATAVQEDEITASKFAMIRNGQTTDEVFDIVKNPRGELVVDGEVAGITGQIYQWKSRDGGILSVQFQNGRVVMKSQYGLR